MNNSKKNTAEMAPEAQERPREEEKPTKREKPPKKPGSVSRFFNQFGIGKYWEKMNEYFEYEEQMEAAAAEKEAKKETAEAMGIASEEAMGAIKARGAEMPQQIESAATRAGAESTETSSIVAEVKAEEAKIEQEAEAAKTGLGEEIKVFVAAPEGEGLPSAEEIIKAREAEELPEWEDVEEPDLAKNIKRAEAVKAEELPPVEEFAKDAEAVAKERAAKGGAAIKAEELPPVEEFEAIAKEHEKKKKAAAVKAEELPPVEEFEEIAKAHEVKTEMEKAKVEPVALGKIKKAGKEMPSAWEDVKPFEFSAADRKKIEAGLWAPKISSSFKARLPEISYLMEEKFFAKGEKMSKARIERMVRSLEKVGEAYVAQKAAKEISATDEKALKKWIAETKGAIEAVREIKPAKVVELKKKKPAKRKAA